ncbi:putative Thioredoxin [Blattamonas nauphoetae]|uniref:Thioredoxin n=1 Tax=Blattamonas nauphoetae TaxID=2049346 RepID=A0ABQ9XX16_9EUKA|nr:putative Thioredoxin [Blattamonas nauphoetae]
MSNPRPRTQTVIHNGSPTESRFAVIWKNIKKYVSAYFLTIDPERSERFLYFDEPREEPSARFTPFTGQTTGSNSSRRDFQNPWKESGTSGSVVKISSQSDYEKRMRDAGSKLVVVKFGAEWCGPCKQIKPEVERLAQANPSVLFLDIDVDQLKQLPEVRTVAGIPEFRFWKNGAIVNKFSGANASKLKEYVNKYK